MKLIQYIGYSLKSCLCCFYPASSIRIQIDLFYFLKLIMGIDIFVDFIPECFIVFSIAYPAEVVDL